MSDFEQHKQDWDELGELDPYWAILASPAARFGKWDVEAFFRTGEGQFRQVMEEAKQLGYPRDSRTVLDFGCGLGRVTRAMTSYFGECCGVDISEPMLEQARRLNQAYPKCHFLRSTGHDLSGFKDNQFDMVYCDIVLQHLPSRHLICAYISEFVRVLKPEGLAVFQVLSFLPLKYRFQPIRKLYRLLRSARVSHHFLYNRLGLQPIRSTFISEAQVLALLAGSGARILKVESRHIAGPAARSATYYCTK